MSSIKTKLKIGRSKKESKLKVDDKSGPEKQEARKLKTPKYTSFKLQARIPKHRPELSGSYRLLWRSLKILRRHWKLFGGIILIYLLLNLTFVQGLNLLKSGDDLALTKHNLTSVYTGNGLEVAGSLFVYLVGGGVSNTSSSADGYQFILLIVVSLVLIWTLRQVYGNNKVRIRDGFYSGIAPLVQFLFVLLVVGLDLIPGAIGIIIYSSISGNGIATLPLEKALWIVATALTILLSLYLVTSTIFALYVVTLPDMTPMRALRSSRELVLYRRWTVMRKVIFMPIALIILGSILMIPFLVFTTKLAPFVYFAMSAAVIAVVHSYMYGLYRELLNER